MSRYTTKVHENIRRALPVTLRNVVAGFAALILPLSLASCKAGDSNEMLAEKSGNPAKLKIGGSSMREINSVERSSLRQIESIELSELLSNSDLTTISNDRKITGPKYEKFSKNGIWEMTSESKRLVTYTGKWKVEREFYIVFDIKELNYSKNTIKDIKRKMYTDIKGNYYSSSGLEDQKSLRLLQILK